jgi:hypothetical protein
MSEVSEDEIWVLSEPGNCPMAIPESADVISVESVAETVASAETVSWLPISVESVLVKLTCPNSLVSAEVISVESAEKIDAIITRSLVSDDPISVESEEDTSNPPVGSTSEVSEELISVASVLLIIASGDEVSVDVISVESAPEKSTCAKDDDSEVVISVESVLSTITSTELVSEEPISVESVSLRLNPPDT